MSGDLFDFLDDLREFSGTDTVLDTNIVDTGSEVILLREFGVRWVGTAFLVEQNLTALAACCFECRLDEVHETNVHDWKFELNVTEVARGFVVLAVVCWANQSRFDNTHVRVHQSLAVRMTVVLVGVCCLYFNSGHLANFNWVHQAEANLCDTLWNHCICLAHRRSSSSSLMATPKLFISSKSSLKAYEVCTLYTSAPSPWIGLT